MNQPLISKINIWQKHEERVLGILKDALLILQNEPNLPKAEIEINRKLFFCLLQSNHEKWELGRGFDYGPVIEGKNPPDPDDEQRSQRENKIPDFYWGYIDHTEEDPRRGPRNFFIECKRLGRPPYPNWILNHNYVNNGILRFTTEEHGYAKNEKSGAMVGYVQDMEFDDILREVNHAIDAASIPRLPKPEEGWEENGTSKINQLLIRPFPISPFHLMHLWVDLRERYK